MAERGIDSGIRRVLTHPAVMVAKQWLKDAWWRARGNAFSNPPIPHDVRSILFVCQGNICRSPFAATRAAALLGRAGLSHVRCLSAGIRATHAARPPREACDAAEAFGLSLQLHEPLQLTRGLIMTVDMAVVVEAGQMLGLRRTCPEATDRIFLLPLFDSGGRAGYARYHIADPFGESPQVFESCYQRIDHALRQLVAAIAVARDTRHQGPQPA
jgi:protein-tyrosine phosphatase